MFLLYLFELCPLGTGAVPFGKFPSFRNGGNIPYKAFLTILVPIWCEVEGDGAVSAIVGAPNS